MDENREHGGRLHHGLHHRTARASPKQTPTLNARIASIPIPVRMRNLPISPEGFPTPWFVSEVDGKRDFRGFDGLKFANALKKNLCWLCGDKMGVHKVFVIGPMCAITRTTSEPGCHRDCAEYAVAACPFLTNPRMRRNKVDLPENNIAGIPIMRNPGVTALWVTRNFRVFHAGNGYLLRLGEPEEVKFYSQGRAATREEVLGAMNTGLPFLREECATPAALAELDVWYRGAMRLLPA